MGQAGWVAKMTNFKALTGGKEPWRAPPTHPKTPAKVTCPSLCFLPQVTNIILHCKADEQAGSRKEGFLLQFGFCFLFLPSHRTGKEMFQQTASRGTALSLLPSQAQSPEHHLVLSHVWRKCVVSTCVPFHIGCRWDPRCLWTRIFFQRRQRNKSCADFGEHPLLPPWTIDYLFATEIRTECFSL